MTSPYGKLLVADIVVPTGGWDWVYVVDPNPPVTLTVPAGTYGSVLAVAAALDTLFSIVGEVTIDELGYTTVTMPSAAEVVWASCDEDLYTLLGFAGTETEVDGIVESSEPHTHGWYPGAITHDHRASRGAGLASGVMWLPVDTTIRQYAGSGAAAIVTPGTLRRTRTLRFDLVSLDEVRDLVRGVAALMETHLHRRFHWYLDRSVGTVAAYGDQGDPAADTDDDCDWWLVTLASMPELVAVPGSSRWFGIEMTVNAEPAA